jgi:integrase
MPRRPLPIPSYRLHRPSIQAVVTLRDPNGFRQVVYLGPYDTPESKAEYHRVVAEWQARGGRLPEPTGGLTVAEVANAYLKHAETYYKHPDGRPTSEIVNVKLAIRSLRLLFGHTLAGDFGPLRFKALREQLVGAKLSRHTINQRCGIVKRIFRWAVAEELAPASIAHALREVPGLKRGRTEAREPDPVRPVPDVHLEAALPFMPPAVAAMARLQQLSGARAGEIILARSCDLNMDGKVGTFVPMRHKSGYRGLPRTIHLGPKAQDVLRPFLKPDLMAFLFSPAEAEADRAADRRAKQQRRSGRVTSGGKSRSGSSGGSGRRGTGTTSPATAGRSLERARPRTCRSSPRIGCGIRSARWPAVSSTWIAPAPPSVTHRRR